MVRKYYVTVFFMCSSLFSVQAAVKKETLPFDSFSNSEVLSGEKEKIEQVVGAWIISLVATPEGKKLYPSSLKTDYDFDRFSKLLNEAKKGDSSVLMEIADVYISSAEKTYRYIVSSNPFYQRSTLSSLYEFNMFFDYSMEKQRMVVMMREWYIACVLLGLAGFSFSEGKRKYISAVEKAQLLYNFFVGFLNQSVFITQGAYRNRFFKSSVKPSVVTNGLFESAVKFNQGFNDLRDIYYGYILPLFVKLSWIKQDVQNSNHPDVLFRYGRILHKAYGEKGSGLAYVFASVEQSHLPAIKYLGKYYLQQDGNVSYHKGEELMMEFLRKNRYLTEKLQVIHELFYLNLDRGDNVIDSFWRGVSSVKRSCLAAFSISRLSSRNGRNAGNK